MNFSLLSDTLFIPLLLRRTQGRGVDFFTQPPWAPGQKRNSRLFFAPRSVRILGGFPKHSPCAEGSGTLGKGVVQYEESKSNFVRPHSFSSLCRVAPLPSPLPGNSRGLLHPLSVDQPADGGESERNPAPPLERFPAVGGIYSTKLGAPARVFSRTRVGVRERIESFAGQYARFHTAGTGTFEHHRRAGDSPAERRPLSKQETCRTPGPGCAGVPESGAAVEDTVAFVGRTGERAIPNPELRGFAPAGGSWKPS